MSLGFTGYCSTVDYGIVHRVVLSSYIHIVQEFWVDLQSYLCEDYALELYWCTPTEARVFCCG